MRTQIFVVASTIASALAMAGCQQEAKVPEPVRPVLSIILQPAASGSTVAVGTVQPRYEPTLGCNRTYFPGSRRAVSESGPFEGRGAA